MITRQVEILGEVYSYRLISRRELREATDRCGGDSAEFEDTIAQLATTVYPPNWPGYDDCLAGIPARITDAVLRSSGYLGAAGEISPLETLAVEWGKTPQSRIDTLICFCFPGLTYSTLEDLDPEEYFRYAVGAQMVAAGLYGMDVSTFLDPDAADEAEPEPPRRPMPEPGPESYLF